MKGKLEGKKNKIEKRLTETVKGEVEAVNRLMKPTTKKKPPGFGRGDFEPRDKRRFEKEMKSWIA